MNSGDAETGCRRRCRSTVTRTSSGEMQQRPHRVPAPGRSRNANSLREVLSPDCANSLRAPASCLFPTGKGRPRRELPGGGYRGGWSLTGRSTSQRTIGAPSMRILPRRNSDCPRWSAADAAPTVVGRGGSYGGRPSWLSPSIARTRYAPPQAVSFPREKVGRGGSCRGVTIAGVGV